MNALDYILSFIGFGVGLFSGIFLYQVFASIFFTIPYIIKLNNYGILIQFKKLIRRPMITIIIDSVLIYIICLISSLFSHVFDGWILGLVIYMLFSFNTFGNLMNKTEFLSSIIKFIDIDKVEELYQCYDINKANRTREINYIYMLYKDVINGMPLNDIVNHWLEIEGLSNLSITLGKVKRQ